ncbi:hypothetical protein [Campylobacter sp. JMF_08 NE1]|nr:hypothetical protein [Campylobacter sp. JMF_08 NE1]MDA3047679.1 hypothetical protein [Campylobacter sp. JMF_08 NE1]
MITLATIKGLVLVVHFARHMTMNLTHFKYEKPRSKSKLVLHETKAYKIF